MPTGAGDLAVTSAPVDGPGELAVAVAPTPVEPPPAAPVVGVFALQGDVREHLAALAAVGTAARPVRRPVELATVDALVLPGGESTTMSRLADSFGLLEPIRERIRAGMPVYGSCAGMILLARSVLDGRPDQQGLDGIDMVVRRNAFGRQVDSFESDLDLAGVPGGPLHAVFIRAPWVEEVGAGVEVLARVGGGAADGRIVAVRQGNLLATSFHPELTGDTRVHELFLEMVVRADAR
ncbi:MAG TPA: pyridoxal 5'-phosphate synthase glutaminase subunit PdxT [Cryptosporangiaceae bacterium]|nr:pyridoxal 5'-phosphate synthase glutaminase subunit PdxT [Cryptosporangiaceae bacterium]